jgi:hypothetical protein
MVVAGLALDNGVSQARSAKEPSKTVVITGCLVKGDEAGEVWLVQGNGRIYGLEGRKIDLNAHLSQKVLVEGYILPEGKEEAAKEAQKGKQSQQTRNRGLSCEHSEDDQQKLYAQRLKFALTLTDDNESTTGSN